MSFEIDEEVLYKGKKVKILSKNKRAKTKKPNYQ